MANVDDKWQEDKKPILVAIMATLTRAMSEPYEDEKLQVERLSTLNTLVQHVCTLQLTVPIPEPIPEQSRNASSISDVWSAVRNEYDEYPDTPESVGEDGEVGISLARTAAADDEDLKRPEVLPPGARLTRDGYLVDDFVVSEDDEQEEVHLPDLMRRADREAHQRRRLRRIADEADEVDDLRNGFADAEEPLSMLSPSREMVMVKKSLNLRPEQRVVIHDALKEKYGFRIPMGCVLYFFDAADMESMYIDLPQSKIEDASLRVIFRDRPYVVIYEKQATISIRKAEEKDEKEECSICLQPFEKDEDLTIINCHQPFPVLHKLCADEWFAKNPSCPKCRIGIKK